MVDVFRKHFPSDRKLLVLVAWSSWRAAKRISTWIASGSSTPSVVAQAIKLDPEVVKRRPATPPSWRAMGLGPVTGVSEGIGHAFAVELARLGLNMVLLARREQILLSLAKQLRAEHGAPACVGCAQRQSVNTHAVRPVPTRRSRRHRHTRPVQRCLRSRVLAWATARFSRQDAATRCADSPGGTHVSSLAAHCRPSGRLRV